MTYNAQMNTVTLNYRSEKNNAGLYLDGTAYCTQCCKTSPFIFLYQGNTNERATALIKDDTITLTSPTSNKKAIIGVQLEYEGYPECALYNQDNLPATPFNLPIQPSTSTF